MYILVSPKNLKTYFLNNGLSTTNIKINNFI